MHRFTLPLCSIVVATLLQSAGAQEAIEHPQPVQEHQWLQKFVGNWTTESKGVMGEGQPPIECTGTLKSRAVGGFWVINEMQGEVMGTQMTGIQTIGYDTEKKKYVGTWVDSMINYMWQYEGTVDQAGTTLTLEAEGPNFMAEGKPTKFHDVYQFKSEDEIVIQSKMLGEDGKWITFMTGWAKRTQ